MNLRHIDPRSTEWMETIEEMTEREGLEAEGDDEDEVSASSGTKSGTAMTEAAEAAMTMTAGRFGKGGSGTHRALSAAAPLRR